MKKHNIDKPKQQSMSIDKTKPHFRLDEMVFAVIYNNGAYQILEGKVYGIHKLAAAEDAEIGYLIRDTSETYDRSGHLFEATYDKVFKEIEPAQQKIMDIIASDYEKIKENLTNTFTKMKASKASSESKEVKDNDLVTELSSIPKM